MQDNQRQAVLYAYLAGIVDGEGTIRICASNISNKPNWNVRYSAHVSVGMTSKIILDKFAETFGARVREERVPYGRKRMYRWGTSGNVTVPKILKLLLPYLIEKRKQAELVIKFCDERMYIGFRRNKKLPQKELRRREELYTNVKKLNAVGAAATK